MDLVTMRTRLRASVGSPQSTDVTDTTLNELINDAYIEICDKFRFHLSRKICTFSTIVGESRYALPDECSEVMHVRDNTNNKPIDRITDNVFTMIVDTALPGKPEKFNHYRNYLRLYPVPDGIYLIELFYKFVVTALAVDGDTPVIPTTWHTGIVRLARYNYWEFVKVDMAKAIQAKNAYKEWLSDKPVEVDEELRWLDSGVIIPNLAQSSDDPERQDWINAE